MKKKTEYVVTFKNSYENLVGMFECHYGNEREAKAAIEFDAAIFANAHSNGKCRQSMRWMSPEKYDYYEVKAKDGNSCIWQYFKI